MPEITATAIPSTTAQHNANATREASSMLPPEVITCLQNARFLHLSTCANNTPHISLMNYTYLPSSPYLGSSTPIIVMTTPPSSRKTQNLQQNPRVSLLVHDWSSHRPPTLSQGTSAGGGSALTQFLQNLNMSSLSRISATINGSATLVPSGSQAEKWLKQKHLENNTFESNSQAPPPPDANPTTNGNFDPLSLFSSSPTDTWGRNGVNRWRDRPDENSDGDGGKKSFIEGDDVRVMVVRINDGRICDWKGGYTDWVLADEGVGEEVDWETGLADGE